MTEQIETKDAKGAIRDSREKQDKEDCTYQRSDLRPQRRPVDHAQQPIQSAQERCRRAKVVNLTWHDWRHQAASRWRREGKDAKVAMRALGHKSVAMYLRYTHVQDTGVAETFGTAQKTRRFYGGFTTKKSSGKKR